MAKGIGTLETRRVRVALLCACAWLWATATGWATAFLYVAPDGGDANPGMIERPLATLHKARGAFLVSAEMRGDNAACVLVQSLRGNPCRFAQPFRRVLEFETEAGAIYAIERSDRPLEQVPLVE